LYNSTFNYLNLTANIDVHGIMKGDFEIFTPDAWKTSELSLFGQEKTWRSRKGQVITDMDAMDFTLDVYILLKKFNDLVPFIEKFNREGPPPPPYYDIQYYFPRNIKICSSICGGPPILCFEIALLE